MNKSKPRVVNLSFLLLFFTAFTYGQTKQPALTQMVKNEQKVKISIVSSEHFIVGSRPWALYIGDKIFTRSQQFDEDKSSTLVFYIPIEDFEALEDHTNIVLCYGIYNKVKDDEPEDYTFKGIHWQLGPLRKDMLLNNE